MKIPGFGQSYMCPEPAHDLVLFVCVCVCMCVFNHALRFNMPHDDSNKCKEDGVKNQQHVMAPTLNYYTNPWMWSKCSRKYITEFLEYVNPILHSTQSQDVVEPVILV